MDNESLDSRPTFLKKFLAGAAIVVILLLIAFPAHCDTATPPQHDNGLGVVIPYENPYIYNFGGIVEGSVVEDAATRKEATSIRFQPFGTFELYTEHLLFCGDRASAFNGMSGPIVLTYRRVAHEMVGGQACHELESVHRVSTNKADQ